MLAAEALPLSDLPPRSDDRADLGSLGALALVLGLVAWAAWPALGLDFWNSDDWFHIEVAAGMLQGDGAAFSRAWFGHVPKDALRLVPYLLWIVDYGLFGLSPAGYYATNLLLHLATVGAVFVLARRLAGSTAPALAAAALFGLNAATTQPLYFLAAREDAMAVLLCVCVAAAWPRLRSSGRGVAVASVLYLLACLCKLPAVALPVGLLALEWTERRREEDRTAPTWRRLLLAFGAAAAFYVLAVLVTVDVPGLLGRVAGPGALAPWPMIGRRLSVLAVPAGAAADAGLLWPDVLVLGALAAGAVAAALLRRPGWPLLAVGATWLVACMVAPAPWLLREALPEDLGGRYLLLPSVGACLVFAGLLPRDGRLGGAVAGLAAASILFGGVAGFVLAGRPMVRHNDSRPSLLLETLAADLDGDRPAKRLVVAVQRPDRGTLALLASGVLRQRFPDLEEAPRVFLQGRSRAMRPTTAPYEYGEYLPGPPIQLDEVGADVLVVTDEHRPAGQGWSVSWRSWRGAGVPPAGSDIEVPDSMLWDFRQLQFAWSAPPAAATWRQGEGWVLRPARALTARSLPHVLVGPPERRPALLVSGPLEIPQGAVCGLVLAVTSPPYEEQPLDEGLVGGPFALLTWSKDPLLPDPFARMLVLPLAGGDEELEVDLRNAPAWRATGTVRHLGLSAAGVHGELALRWIRPQPCP